MENYHRKNKTQWGRRQNHLNIRLNFSKNQWIDSQVIRLVIDFDEGDSCKIFLSQRFENLIKWFDVEVNSEHWIWKSSETFSSLARVVSQNQPSEDVDKFIFGTSFDKFQNKHSGLPSAKSIKRSSVHTIFLELEFILLRVSWRIISHAVQRFRYFSLEATERFVSRQNISTFFPRELNPKILFLQSRVLLSSDKIIQSDSLMFL